MSETTRPAQDSTSEWHWAMTVQTPDGVFNTRTAVITVPRDFTRAQAWDYVFKQFKADYGNTLTVLFFDLQPNQL